MPKLEVGGIEFDDQREPEADFERAVGRLAFAWARLESGIAGVLNAVIDGRETWSGRTLYYSTSNIGPRLEVVDHSLRDLAIRDGRYAEAYRTWERFRRQVQSEASKRRNNIIHGELVGETDQGTMVLKRYIQPYFSSRIRGDGPLQKRIIRFGVSDIENAVLAAEQLFAAACALNRAIEWIRSGAAPDAELSEVERLMHAAKPIA